MITDIAKKLSGRISSDIDDKLDGLTEQHIKFITFYIKERLGFKSFRYEINYLNTPKSITIHIYSENHELELYCKPKPVNLFDKMAEYLGLNNKWTIEFAKRSLNE